MQRDSGEVGKMQEPQTEMDAEWERVKREPATYTMERGILNDDGFNRSW